MHAEGRLKFQIFPWQSIPIASLAPAIVLVCSFLLVSCAEKAEREPLSTDEAAPVENANPQSPASSDLKSDLPNQTEAPSSSENGLSEEETTHQDQLKKAEVERDQAIAAFQPAYALTDVKTAQKRWETAIGYLQQIPETSQYYSTAQTKLAEYQKELAKVNQFIAAKEQSPEASPLVASGQETASSPSPTPTQTPVAQSFEQGLANHLNRIGARMYGAYWCPYCRRQRELFAEAASLIDEVECDPRGQNAQPGLCDELGIRSYPTWIINGQVYRGMQPLERLARLSGYQG